MVDSDDVQKREFVRVAVELPIRYKFISGVEGKKDDTIYKGSTTNFSAGGLLLKGPLPNNDWVVDLLMSHIVLGVNVFLPGYKDPVKTLARVSWVESLTEEGICSMGIRFKEITREHRDRIVQLIIQNEMP